VVDARRPRVLDRGGNLHRDLLPTPPDGVAMLRGPVRGDRGLLLGMTIVTRAGETPSSSR
jgi:hypothetical protein